MAFTGLVVLVALQRVWELRRSRRNERTLRLLGAREYARWQVPLMAALHTLWIASAVLEVWLLAPSFRPGIAGLALAVLAAGQTLRYLAMTALGSRWTVSVMTVPGTPPVVGGVYRFVRHPNYVGVILEIAALPLVHGAIRTAALFSLANLILLAMRIRAEERALATDNAYLDHLGSRRRFLPSLRSFRPTP